MRSSLVAVLLSCVALLGVSANPVPGEALEARETSARDVHETMAELEKRIGGPICYCYDHIYHCGPQESPC